MPESPDELTAEVKRLAEALTATDNEDVLDSAAVLAREYKGKVRMIHALDDVDRMIQGDIVAIEDRLQSRLLKTREELRDALRRLLEWGRETGRM